MIRRTQYIMEIFCKLYTTNPCSLRRNIFVEVYPKVAHEIYKISSIEYFTIEQCFLKCQVFILHVLLRLSQWTIYYNQRSSLLVLKRCNNGLANKAEKCELLKLLSDGPCSFLLPFGPRGRSIKRGKNREQSRLLLITLEPVQKFITWPLKPDSTFPSVRTPSS